VVEHEWQDELLDEAEHDEIAESANLVQDALFVAREEIELPHAGQ
jgi:hypothetical protein